MNPLNPKSTPHHHLPPWTKGAAVQFLLEIGSNPSIDDISPRNGMPYYKYNSPDMTDELAAELLTQRLGARLGNRSDGKPNIVSEDFLAKVRVSLVGSIKGMGNPSPNMNGLNKKKSSDTSTDVAIADVVRRLDVLHSNVVDMHHSIDVILDDVANNDQAHHDNIMDLLHSIQLGVQQLTAEQEATRSALFAAGMIPDENGHYKKAEA